MARAAVLATVCLVLVGACAPVTRFPGVNIDVQEGRPGGSECSEPFIDGELAPNEPWGLGVRDLSTGITRSVKWPPRFRAVVMDGKVTLLDHNLNVVARVGDVVRVPGEVGPVDDLWFACRNVSVLIQG